MGNPHAVAFVDSLDEAGSLLEEPGYDHSVYPDGVNVEFVVRRSAAPRRDARARARVRRDPFLRHRRVRGDGRGSARGRRHLAGRRTASTSPAARLEIAWTEDDRILMTGPAVLVAEGTTDL